MESENIGAGSTEVIKQGQVNKQLGILGEYVVDLERAVSTLQTSLISITKPEEVSEVKEESKCSEVVPLAQELRILSDRILVSTEKIRLLEKRVEL